MNFKHSKAIEMIREDLMILAGVPTSVMAICRASIEIEWSDLQKLPASVHVMINRMVDERRLLVVRSVHCISFELPASRSPEAV